VETARAPDHPSLWRGALFRSHASRQGYITVPVSPIVCFKFSPVAADGVGHLHIYYGQFYVGVINPGARWRVWLHNLPLGDFDELEVAKRAVAEGYYGTFASGSDEAR
jgi:hypothetical protein